MPRHLALTLVLIFTLIGSTAVQAGPLVLRPLAPGLEGEYSNFGPPGESHQQVADVFVLTQAATLHSLTWYGRYDALYSTAGPIGFEVRIFGDSAGSPALSPSWVKNESVNAIPFGEYSPGVPWLEYSMTLPGWSLGAGTYWLSIVEAHAPTPPYGKTQWLWGDTDARGWRAIRNGDDLAWVSSFDTSHAFTLEGSVPDPGSTLFLFGIALAGLGTWRKRRQ
jgi:hypothetical protein